MAVIKHTDLFDFDGYERALRGAEAGIKEFSTAAGVSIDRVEKQTRELTKQIAKLRNTIRSVNVIQRAAGASLSDYGSKVESLVVKLKDQQEASTMLHSALQSVNDQLKAQKTRYYELKQELEQYNSSNKKASAAARQLGKEIKETTVVLTLQEKESRRAAQSILYAEGSYKRMQQQLTGLRNALKEMPNAFDRNTGAINKNNLQAVRLSNEIERLDKVLKKADGSMGIFSRNVGNYSSSFKGLGGSIGGIVSSLGLLIGINSGFEALKYIIDANKNLEALEVRLKLVSGSQFELSQNTKLAADVADRYGIEIQVATNQLAKFTAASNMLGFSTGKTRKLFEQFSKSFGNLKLSTDDAQSAFTAIEQIMSKGKVSAEELRRQLGNVLPGAFQIAAKSIGVTTSELDKMLRKGEVLSGDFIPKFANELERTFGKLDRVESLQAAIARFYNSLQLLVRSDTATAFFTEIVNMGTKLIDVLKYLSNGFEDSAEKSIRLAAASKEQANEAEKLVGRYEELAQKTKLTVAEKNELAGIETRLYQLFGDSIFEIDKQTGAYRLNASAVKDLIRQKILLANSEASTTALKLDNTIIRSKEATAAAIKFADLLATKQREYGISYNDVLKKYAESVEKLYDGGVSKKLNQQEAEILDLFNAFNKNRKVVRDSAIEYRKLEGQLKELGFTIKDVENLLNPSQGTDKPTGGNADDNGNGESSFNKALSEAKKRLDVTKDRVKQEQELEKENAEALLLIAEKQRELNILDEIEYQNRVFEIKKASSERLIELEKSLGVNGSAVKIKQFQNETLKAEVEQTKNITSERERRAKETQRIFDEASKKELDAFDATSAAFMDNMVERWSQEKKLREEQFKNADDLNKIQLEGVRNLDVSNTAKIAAELLYYKKRLELAKKFQQDTAEIEAQIAETTRALYAQLSTEIAEQGSQIFTGLSERRVQALESEKDRAIEAAGQNADARERIEKEYNRKITQEKRKQAIAQKAAALFTLGINTALAIQAAFAPPTVGLGPVAGGPLAIAMGVLGALQAAAIIAKPLPAFKRGVKHSPSGPAWVDEDGPEFRISPSGKVFLGSKKGANIVNLEKGTEVIPARQTANIIRQLDKNGGSLALPLTDTIHHIQMGKIAEMEIIAKSAVDMGEMRRIMNETVGGLVIERNTWDERGYRRSEQTKNQTINYLNNRKTM